MCQPSITLHEIASQAMCMRRARLKRRIVCMRRIERVRALLQERRHPFMRQPLMLSCWRSRQKSDPKVALIVTSPMLGSGLQRDTFARDFFHFTARVGQRKIFSIGPGWGEISVVGIA